jgi:hypothetical protein
MEPRRLKPPKRSSKELDQTTMPASAATNADSTDEPEEAEEEKHCGRQKNTSQRSKK